MKNKENKQTKKKRGKFFKIFIAFLAIALALTVVAVIFVTWYNNAIYTPMDGEAEISFRVESGASLVNIADDLETAGVIKSKDALKLYLRLNNLDPVIKAGDYDFEGDLTVPELIEVLEAGTFKPATQVTVQEGLLNEDIAEIFTSELSSAGDNKEFSSTEFLDIIANPNNYDFSEEVDQFLAIAKPADKPLGGYLFPDTYNVGTDATAQNIIEMMILNLQKRLKDNDIDPTEVATNQSTLSNFYEVLTLASIIEREAGRNDDASVVSSVFHNRLAANYPLQADSTVNFVTGKNDAGVLISDTKIDSPYNTYKYSGLPPTPINNPGIRSIKAAMNPADTDYFFFWHSSTGQVYFAVTYEQHQANIRNYP